MRMGVREICDVVFRPLTAVDIGNQHFDAGQPVLYLDTAKTSSLEGAATTVYAQGGKGNPRLIGWDGEKTVTFTVEDALISPVSFSMLSGAGIVKGRSTTGDVQKIYTHQVYDLVVETTGTGTDAKYYVKLPAEVRNADTIVVSKEAPIYATILDSAGGPKTFLSAIKATEIFTEDTLTTPVTVTNSELQLGASDAVYFQIADTDATNYTDTQVKGGNTVRIDCYTVHANGAQEIQIDAENFAGFYYIEADTLFRDETTGQDLPAQFIIPRGKIQSNFTFTMANSGDPSTFTFTIDAFPAYTKFNKNKKVMAALQIVDPTDAGGHNYADKTVLGHTNRTQGADIYGEGVTSTAAADMPYTNSIFDANTSQQSDEGGNGEGGSDTTTDTYTQATQFDANVTTYYVKDGDNYVAADPQPTADNFGQGTYYIKQ